eukprot:6176378-Pyramimonas_sp.AAC.1
MIEEQQGRTEPDLIESENQIEFECALDRAASARGRHRSGQAVPRYTTAPRAASDRRNIGIGPNQAGQNRHQDPF